MVMLEVSVHGYPPRIISNIMSFILETIMWVNKCTFWSSVEKTSMKQSLKCKISSNFQMSFLHLVRWTPHR